MKKKTKRERKPSPEAAALLLIADHLAVLRTHLLNYPHPYLIVSNDIAVSLQEQNAILTRIRHSADRIEIGISNAIYNATRELKPAPSWWRCQYNRLQLWWWNRKLSAPVIERQNVVADAIQKHEDKIKDAPPCGRWS
jgi:hypothetical protein